MDAAHALVRAMIHRRLDYCNSVLAGLPTGQMSCLQSVLHSATRLVLGLPGRAPVSAAMHDTLHWLSFLQRFTYKLCLYTSVCMVRHMSCFCTSLILVLGHSLLRSAEANKLVPQSCTTSLGVSSPTAWNDLLAHLRNSGLNCQRLDSCRKPLCS